MSSSVAPYNDDTHEDLKAKHPFKPAPSLPHISIDHHHLIASPTVVLDRIKSFPRGTSCGRDGLRAQHLMNCLSGAAVAIFDELVSSITQVVNLFLDGNCPKILGEYIASAPLTPLVKPGGGIRPIAVGTVWRRLVFKVSAVLIGHSLDGYFHDLQFSVGVSGGGEAILHTVNRLIEGRGDDIGLSMMLVDFKNAFNLVDREVMLEEVRHRCPAISRWVWYLDDGTIIGDTLVIGKVLELIMKDGPRCGLHLNIDKTEVFWPKEDPKSRLAGFFLPNITRPLNGVKLLGGPVSVDFNFSTKLVMKRVAKTIKLIGIIAKINDPQCELQLLRACAERIVTASGPGFGDCQWRLATLPFAFGGFGVQVIIVAFGPAFNDALCAFNTKMKTGLLSHANGFVAIQMEDHTLDWLRAVLNSGLGQTMNNKTYRCVLCYRLGVPLFFVSKPCSACSKVFTGDIYGDHAISCASIIGIKHWHNVVRDCHGISAGTEVDIGLGGGCDKPLRPLQDNDNSILWGTKGLMFVELLVWGQVLGVGHELCGWWRMGGWRVGVFVGCCSGVETDCVIVLRCECGARARDVICEPLLKRVPAAIPI
ncbi:hypothetical protein Tco_0962797 [Tanacetum coccineum]